MERTVQELLSYRIGVEAGHFFSGGIHQSLHRSTSFAKKDVDCGAYPMHKSCYLRMRIRKPPPVQKRIFFIRHGQSEWNRATEETFSLRDVFTLDHPLSNRGVAEAESLRQRILRASRIGTLTTAEDLVDANEFLSAPTVISSPLTRALQTAMITLRDHPVVQRQGIRLISDVRELKNTISLDTISKYRGDEIADRCRRKLTIMSKLDRERVRRARTTAAMLGHDTDTAETNAVPHGSAPTFKWTNIDVDSFDSRDDWWDLIETPAEKVEHVRRLVMMLRMLPHRRAVVVGHSLCFKAMVRRYGANALETPKRKKDISVGNKGVSEDFKRKKLENCAVVALDFDFSYGIDEALANFGSVGTEADADYGHYKPIRAARLVFGSNFTS